MSTPLSLSVYCLLIIAASVAGGLVPLLVRLTHTRLQLAISLAAGFMLGVAVLHMIPHALYDLAPAAAMLWVLAGFLFMFFLERFFSFHSHEVAELDDQGQVLTPAADLPAHEPHDHAAHHGHAHPHGMHGPTPANKLSWTGAALGLTLHSLIAGIALGSAVLAETGGDHGPALAGLAVFLVIVLHKPLDSLTVITLTAAAGLCRTRRHVINGLFALAVPAGVALLILGVDRTALADSGTLVAAALAFSAGTFLCVSLSDLLPELHFHSHDRGKLSAALLLGVGLAIAVARAEHALHDHDHHGHAPGSGHDHADHQDQNPHGHDHPDHDEHAGHDHDESQPPSSPPPPQPSHHDHSGHDHGDHAGHGHDHH
ncbi:MAG: ZIP family metal transporter [Planctomycetota bacterium]